MKFQQCFYKTESSGVRRDGIAAMSDGFNTYSVKFIVDAETGEKLKEPPYDYDLISTPLSCIDTDYLG